MIEWKDIIDFEGLYKVSDNGDVLSLARKDRLGRPFPQTMLKPDTKDFGHFRVTLFKNGKRHKRLVSRLVAIHFISNPHNYPVVRHNDDNPQNNHVSNLSWGTYKDNSEDMVKRNRQAKGEKNGMYGKTGSQSPSAKVVLNTQTGIYYESAREAAKTIGMDKGYLAQMLAGSRRNKTPFIYA